MNKELIILNFNLEYFNTPSECVLRSDITWVTKEMTKSKSEINESQGYIKNKHKYLIH